MGDCGDWHGALAASISSRGESAEARFAGQYAETPATITWSASENGFTFTSNAASTSTSLFGETGHERNGIFFSQG